MRYLIVVLASIILLSCSPNFTKVVPAPSDYVSPHKRGYTYYKSYLIGTKNKAVVGGNIIELCKIELDTVNYYKAIKGGLFPATNVKDAPRIKTGSEWDIYKKTEQGFLISNNDFSVTYEVTSKGLISKKEFSETLYLEINPTGEVLSGIIKRASPSLYEPIAYYYAPINDKVGIIRGQYFELENKVNRLKSSIVYNVVYLGKTGTTIKFQYEEHYKAAPRGAFYKTFEYELQDGKTLNMKNIIIEVTKCDNLGIEYIIKDDTGIAEWVEYIE